MWSNWWTGCCYNLWVSFCCSCNCRMTEMSYFSGYISICHQVHRSSTQCHYRKWEWATSVPLYQWDSGFVCHLLLLPHLHCHPCDCPRVCHWCKYCANLTLPWYMNHQWPVMVLLNHWKGLCLMSPLKMFSDCPMQFWCTLLTGTSIITSTKVFSGTLYFLRNLDFNT